MDEKEILEKVKQVFLKTFASVEESKFRIDMPPEDIEEWDSLSHMTLISELENEFNISMEIDEISEMDSVKNVVEVLKKKLGGAE